MRRPFAMMVAIVILIGSRVSLADEVLLADLYGSGVHQFNSGNYKEAHADLSAAIQEGSTDPRAFYFRGLTYLRLGREQEAIADFEKGADFESGASAGVYPVSRSLERIQGPARKLLERYRADARVNAHKRQEELRQTQHRKRIADEEEVLRKVPSAGDPFAIPTPTPSGRPQKPSATTDEANPFEPGAPSDANPFDPSAGGAKPDAKPMPEDDANPFGGTPAPTPMPPADEPPKAEADPFGGDPPAQANPPADGGAGQGSSTGQGSSVKPTPNGIGGVFKSIMKGLTGGVSPGDLTANMPGLPVPLPGIGGQPPAGDMPPFPGDVPLPSDGSVPPAGSGNVPPPMTPPGADDPFGSPPATPTPSPMPETPAPTPTPPSPMPPAGDDPFGPPSGGTPGTPAPATPAPATPAPQPMAPDAGDPFGPGGGTPPTPAPAPATPAPTPMPPAGDDPFGPSSPPKPSEAPTTPPTPPAGDDPFGPSTPTPSEAPSTPKPDDDPFGN